VIWSSPSRRSWTGLRARVPSQIGNLRLARYLNWEELSKYWLLSSEVQHIIFKCQLECAAPNGQLSHNNIGLFWISVNTKKRRCGLRKNLSYDAFPEVLQLQQISQILESSRRGAELRNLLKKIILWKIEYFIPIWIELATWFITSLFKNTPESLSFSLELYLVDARSQFCMRITTF